MIVKSSESSRLAEKCSILLSYSHTTNEELCHKNCMGLFCSRNCTWRHRIIELFRFEKTSKIIRSNHNLTILPWFQQPSAKSRCTWKESILEGNKNKQTTKQLHIWKTKLQLVLLYLIDCFLLQFFWLLHYIYYICNKLHTEYTHNIRNQACSGFSTIPLF